MKDRLTPEESQRLIELGVDPSKASMCMLYFPESDNSEPLESWQMWEECGKLLCNPDESQVQDVECVIVPKSADYDLDAKEEYPIFDLSDILSLLPKEFILPFTDIICRMILEWSPIMKQWHAAYKHIDKEWLAASFLEDEPIDALFELLVWCITNRHLKV